MRTLVIVSALVGAFCSTSSVSMDSLQDARFADDRDSRQSPVHGLERSQAILLADDPDPRRPVRHLADDPDPRRPVLQLAEDPNPRRPQLHRIEGSNQARSKRRFA